MKNVHLSSSEDCRLNSLPDPIRNQIVCFLPPKDAAKVSLLSRQWRHVCSSLSNLNFDQTNYQNEGQIVFRNLVDRLLLNHDTSSITSFNLSASVDSNHITDLHVNAWISFALRHNVQHLYLRILSPPLKQLPCCIFTCISLQVLSLDNMKLNLSSAISLPKLKTLNFSNVQFDSTNFSRKLLPNCPLLEDLVLRRCRDNAHSFKLSISLPTLKTLTFYSSFLEINICAPKLKLLKCQIVDQANITSETLSSVAYAEFDTLRPQLRSSVTEILLGLTKVKSLRLLWFSIKVLYMSLNSLACCPTLCCSLKHLQLEMCAEEGQVQVLIVLLRGFTNLQTLNVSFQDSVDSCRINNYQKSNKILTGYLLNHLKTVEIKEFGLELEHELDIVRYLLENAKVLEKMIIEYSIYVKSKMETRLRVCETMLTFTKISPYAKIVFDTCT